MSADFTTQPEQTILLLGNYRPTLTLARVLSSQGNRIISGLHGCDGGAEYSRYVDQIWDHPGIDTAPEAFLSELADFTKANNVSVVLPVSEDFVSLFAANPDADCGGAVIAMMAPELIGRCLDKIGMMELACENNVPTAAFAIVHDQIQLAAEVKKIGFPLVIRPKASTSRLDGKKAIFITDKADLQKQIPRWPSDQTGLILQKKAHGKRHNIYFAAKNGVIYRYLHAVILRTDNPDGSGLAVEGITIEPTPALRRHTVAMLKAMKYSGIGCAQYLVDEKNGKVSFLEINCRIAGNHAVPEQAGLNLSTILIDMAKGRDLDTTSIEGKVGKRYVWTCGDIQAAKIAWLKGDVSIREAIFWILRAFGAALRADLHMTFSLSDPKPGLMALKNQIPNIRKLTKRLRQFSLRTKPMQTTPNN